MTDVTPRLKDKVDCPCDVDQCEAYGTLNPKTGHVKDCHPACERCARTGRKPPKVKDSPELKANRRIVAARAKGLCEAKAHRGCKASSPPRFGQHAHHVRRRTQGGSDKVSNLLWVCFLCHDWIHDHPKLAAERGLLDLRKDT